MGTVYRLRLVLESARIQHWSLVRGYSHTFLAGGLPLFP